jgi:uncharacterized integral membrane protein
VRRFVYWFVTLSVAFLLVLFAVSNPQWVDIELWPLPYVKPAPLYAVVLVAVLIGFLFGELVAWINGSAWRRDARHKGRRIEALERELAATQAQLRPAPGPRLPVPGAPRT